MFDEMIPEMSFKLMADSDKLKSMMGMEFHRRGIQWKCSNCWNGECE